MINGLTFIKEILHTVLLFMLHCLFQLLTLNDKYKPLKKTKKKYGSTNNTKRYRR